MQRWLDVFREIGKEASETAMNLTGTPSARKNLGRGAGGDITRGIDKAVEDVILKHLKEAGNVKLISEESGEITMGNPEGVVITDPLDGSSNAKDGIPLFSTSMAFAESEAKIGSIQVAYVRNLVTGDEYHARRGKGSFLNQKRIKTSDTDILKSIGCELYPQTQESLTRTMKVMAAVSRARCFGSVALDLCFVAQGALSGYVDFRNCCRLLDISAASLILKEAGGIITGDEGRSLESREISTTSWSNLVCAQNSRQHKRLIEIARDY